MNWREETIWWDFRFRFRFRPNSLEGSENHAINNRWMRRYLEAIRKWKTRRHRRLNWRQVRCNHSRAQSTFHTSWYMPNLYWHTLHTQLKHRLTPPHAFPYQNTKTKPITKVFLAVLHSLNNRALPASPHNLTLLEHVLILPPPLVALDKATPYLLPQHPPHHAFQLRLHHLIFIPTNPRILDLLQTSQEFNTDDRTPLSSQPSSGKPDRKQTPRIDTSELFLEIED